MTDTSVMQDRIGQLCGQFKLPTVGAQSVTRFTAAGHGDALATFLEVLEQEAEDRRHRRINRLRRESRLPPGKTGETFEHDRMPLALRQQLDHLAQGSFVERGVNVLAFGLPGTGRPTPGAPWATAWWKPATPSSSHRPTAWCRNSSPPSAIWTCPASCASWTTSTSCSSTGLPAPGRRGIRGPLHPHRRTLRAPVVGHHVKPGLLGVGAHLRQPHRHRRGD